MRAASAPSTREEDQRAGRDDGRSDAAPARPRRRAAAARRRRRSVAAEASAAWTGRAVSASEMPSSSRACAPSASCAISCVGDLARRAPARARAARRSPPARAARLRRRSRAPRARASRSARLGVGLRADRDVLARGHRHRARDQPGDAGDQHRCARPLGRGDAEDQARGRDDAVVGAEHRGAQPADAVASDGIHDGFSACELWPKAQSTTSRRLRYARCCVPSKNYSCVLRDQPGSHRPARH